MFKTFTKIITLVSLFAGIISIVHAQGGGYRGSSRIAIAVENFTGEKWLGKYAAFLAPKAIYEFFQEESGLSMLAATYNFKLETSNFYVAEVGLTHMQLMLTYKRPRVVS